MGLPEGQATPSELLSALRSWSQASSSLASSPLAGCSEVRGLEFTGPKEERPERSWKYSLLGARTPGAGGGGAGGPDSWVWRRRGWGPGLLGPREDGPGNSDSALARGSTGLDDCKKLPNPSWSKAVSWRGSGWGEGKVPEMGLGSERMRVTQEAWSQAGRPGAWEVERDMASDGGRRPLFECRGLGFEAREQQDQMS